jgi:hypothetical protein
VVREGPTSFDITVYHTVTDHQQEVRLVDIRGRDVGHARITLVNSSQGSTVLHAEVSSVVYPVWARIGGVTIKLQ